MSLSENQSDSSIIPHSSQSNCGLQATVTLRTVVGEAVRYVQSVQIYIIRPFSCDIDLVSTEVWNFLYSPNRLGVKFQVVTSTAVGVRIFMLHLKMKKFFPLNSYPFDFCFDHLVFSGLLPNYKGWHCCQMVAPFQITSMVSTHTFCVQVTALDSKTGMVNISLPFFIKSKSDLSSYCLCNCT